MSRLAIEERVCTYRYCTVYYGRTDYPYREPQQRHEIWCKHCVSDMPVTWLMSVPRLCGILVPSLAEAIRGKQNDLRDAGLLPVGG